MSRITSQYIGNMKNDVEKYMTEWIQRLYCGGDVVQQANNKTQLLKQLRSATVEEQPVEHNDTEYMMYDIPMEFVQTLFGSRIKFSACFWPEGVTNIDEAEDASLALYCDRARIEDGQTIMDLGGGWGALAFYLCEKYPNVKVTSISNGRSQQEFIEKTAIERGYQNRILAITADFHIYETTERYDRIFCSGIFEYVNNWNVLLKKISHWLHPEGFLFIQLSGHKHFPFTWDTVCEQTSWAQELLPDQFRGAMIASSDSLLYFQDYVSLVNHWCLSGEQYGKTNMAWMQNIENNKDKLLSVFSRVYGDTDGPKHLFSWMTGLQIYLFLFSYNKGNEFITTQYLMKRKTFG